MHSIIISSNICSWTFFSGFFPLHYGANAFLFYYFGNETTTIITAIEKQFIAFFPAHFYSLLLPENKMNEKYEDFWFIWIFCRKKKSIFIHEINFLRFFYLYFFIVLRKGKFSTIKFSNFFLSFSFFFHCD